ncbi:hypothetical protein CEXT_726181, partial [Caerostris extrusa]
TILTSFNLTFTTADSAANTNIRESTPNEDIQFELIRDKQTDLQIAFQRGAGNKRFIKDLIKKTSLKISLTTEPSAFLPSAK